MRTKQQTSEGCKRKWWNKENDGPWLGIDERR